MKLYIYILFLLSLESFPCKFLKSNILHEEKDDRVIITIKTDNEDELSHAINILNKVGGKIIIDTPVISISSITKVSLDGYSSGGLVGVKQANGEYPRIDFSKRKERMKTFSYVLSGIYIYGSHKYIKNLIIENSNSHGIELYHNFNEIDHVITRYNSGSGIYIPGNYSSLNYCYSYRNCDKTLEKDYTKETDGFTFDKYNVDFNNCYAWDNLGYGFQLHVRSKLGLTHSASWNNGNPDVFTGKYDYDKGRPLDKNMETIQDIMDSDKEFESNYNSKNFNIDKAKINGIIAKKWTSKVKANKADGFAFSTDALTGEINLEYDVAFDNENFGFNDLYRQVCPAKISKCASFDNKENYKFNYKYEKWEDNWGWYSSQEEKKDENVKIPKDIDRGNKSFNHVKDIIENAVKKNYFPDEVNFDNAINGLK